MDFNFKTKIEKEEGNYSKIIIEPLSPGFGQTIGNSLRRVLLGYLPGAAVTSVHVAGVQHQFTTMQGMKEDIVDFVLNLKSLRVAYTGAEPVTLKLIAKGPGEVTAEKIQIPQGVSIANPELVLANLSEGSLEADITIETGVGYSPSDERQINTVGVIPVDAGFSPIVRVNYDVASTRVGRLTNFDKIILEVWTDGTVKAIDALKQAATILRDSFENIVNPIMAQEEEVAEETEVTEQREVLKLTVEELELPTRIANALRKSGLTTVKDLLEAPQEEIMKVKNLGGKSISIIQEALRSKGVELA